jgi:hypothetical protein
MAGIACAPTPREAAEAFSYSLQSSESAPGEDLLSLLTPGSRELVLGLEGQGAYRDARRAILATMRTAAEVNGEPGVMRGRDPADTLFFVRDGHARRLDLALSGVLFQSLRADSYPSSW